MYLLFNAYFLCKGAMGAVGLPVAAAELEGGDEPGLVTVDTPTAPNNDVEALLHQVLYITLLILSLTWGYYE